MRFFCLKIGAKISRQVSKLGLLFLGVSLITNGLAPLSVQAANPKYQAQISGSLQTDLTLSPGETKSVQIKFKNKGTATWKNSGANYVSLVSVTLPKTGDPIKKISVFADKGWGENFRPVKLLETTVPPSQVGTFNFVLKAPEKEGQYQEDFTLVAKNLAWIGEAKVSYKISVKAAKQISPKDGGATTRVKQVYTTRDQTYAAAKLIQSDKNLEIIVGQEREFIVGFKNVGKKVWSKDGPRYVSLYTTDPSYRKSDFYSSADPNWASDHQIRLTEPQVKPGEIGYFKFKLKAPDQPGEYEETFRLVAEDWTWIKDSELVIPVTVQPKAVVKAPETTPTANQVVYRDKLYAAVKLIQSASELDLKPGEAATFRVGFKNVGTKIWNAAGSRYISLYTAGPNYRASLFAPALTAASGWLGSNQVKMETSEVKPGEIGYFTFDLKAPTRAGEYKETFRLASEEWSWVQGGDLQIPVQVVGDESPINSGEAPSAIAPKTVEPMMRVGLFHTKEEVKISANGQFEIRTSDGQLLEIINPGQLAVLNFDFENKLYKLVTSNINQGYADYLRFVPTSQAVIMEIANYEKRPSWNLSINYNKFRGVIEARYSPAKGRFWIINELPMEQYLQGMAETSNGLPLEFLKTMTVAARTYGFYHALRQSKHKDEFFTVDAFYDQVYRGYSSEKSLTDLQAAVEETRGLVVTYGGEIAITPYFSRSDGRTRDWSEVWGGTVPWAVSVPVPQDAGRTLWGHGVGLSARGALLMARDEGRSMEDLIKHFYRGVGIEKWY